MVDTLHKHPEHATEIAPVSAPPTQIDAVRHSEKDNKGEGDHDENVVDWDGPHDPEMPTNWPKHRKFAIIGVVTASRFLTTLASSMMSPALLNIRADFAGTSETIITFTVSIYMIGYGIGPLVLAPMSEVYGRSPIYHAGNVLYTIFSVGCALAPNVAGLLVFRFLAGLAGGVPVTNAGGTIADVIPHHRRGLIQSIFGASVLVAPSLAPVAGGFLVEAAGWRWIFWLMTILSGLVTIASFVLLRETYGPVLLQRKAARLRRELGNDLFHARGSTGLTLRQKTVHAIRRPIVLLCRSPIIILGSLYLALVYGIAYLLLTSIPLVFHDVYGWSQWAAGLAPLGTSVGYFVGVFVTGRYSDRIYVRQRERLGGEAVPECRLFFLFPAAVALPTGLIVYGWAAQFHTQWVLPLVGTGIFSLGMIFVFDGIQSYIIDSFSSYAASATAAISLVRCIAGGLLPLSGPEMYRHLGYGWGNTLLGIVSAVFGVASLGLWRYGERLRERDPVRLD